MNGRGSECGFVGQGNAPRGPRSRRAEEPREEAPASRATRTGVYTLPGTVHGPRRLGREKCREKRGPLRVDLVARHVDTPRPARPAGGSPEDLAHDVSLLFGP